MDHLIEQTNEAAHLVAQIASALLTQPIFWKIVALLSIVPIGRFILFHH